MCKYPTPDINLDDESAPAKLLKLVGTNKKVLEFGCATGYVSKVIKEQLNGSVTGIEISPEAAKEARKYCERVIVDNIDNITLSDIFNEEQFDVITFGDVLEHLINPSRILKAVRPFIAENGYILASIPNIAHMSVALELLDGKFDYRPYGLLDDTHLKFFTKKSILSLFKEIGYEIVIWDRVIVNPEDTEFKTVLSNYPDSLLSYFGAGSEALTYQFIIKAVPSASELKIIESLKDRENKVLPEFKDQLTEIEWQLSEKERQLRNIHKSWSWKITSPLRLIAKIIRK